MYIEDWGKFNIKNKIQLSCTIFLAKYGSLAIHDEDMEKRFIIDQKKLKFDKNSGWNLIGIPDKPDVTFSDNDTFCIHDDIFNRIQSTHQDINIMWGLTSN